jgi:hypothetical protein
MIRSVSRYFEDRESVAPFNLECPEKILSLYRLLLTFLLTFLFQIQYFSCHVNSLGICIHVHASHASPGLLRPNSQSVTGAYIARINKRLKRPEIDSQESIPPGWESIPGLPVSLKGLQIRAQGSITSSSDTVESEGSQMKRS